MQTVDRPSRTDTRSRISYNAVVRFGGRSLGGLISLAALHLAAHYFEPVGWGPIAAAIAFVGIFSSLADFGISSVLARDLVGSRTPEDLFGTGVAAALILSIGATVVAAGVGVAVFGSLPATRTLVLTLLPTIPASALFAALSSVFVARSRNDIRAIFDVLSSLLPLAGVLVIVSLGTDQNSYGILMSATSVVMAVVGMAAVWHYLRPRLRKSFSKIWTVANEAWPLGASQLTGAVYLQIDVLLVVAFLSTREVGLYGLASQIAGFLASVPAMVTVAATPAFMRKSAPARRRLAAVLLRVLGVGAVATVLIGIFLSHFVLMLVGGGRFTSAAPALCFLLVAAACSFLVSTFSAVIYLTGNQRYLVRIGIAVLVINVAANLVAIPAWGMTGAAGALVVSEMIALGSASAFAARIGFGFRQLL